MTSLLISIIVSFAFGYITGGFVNGARIADHSISHITRKDVERGIKKYNELKEK